jgi:hypothetical protein
MGKRTLIFNIIYYTIIFTFIKMGRDDSSSSLGYGYFIIIFWVIAAIVLTLFLNRKIIHPKSILEKIGVFTATPILSIVVVGLILSFKERGSAEWYFNKGDYRYKVKTFNYKETLNEKRVEYYRSKDASTWLKDSTWLYFSESGDTLKKIKYKNDIEIK